MELGRQGRRDHARMTRASDGGNAPDLRGFFAPRSIALVGASDDRSRFAGKVLDRIKRFGATGEVFPVNPSSKVVQGLVCYPSLRALPRAAEHVGIAVPTARVLDVLADCAATGVRFVTVFASGFGETGTQEGRALEARITTFARETGIRIMGPNCNGFVNFVDRFAFTSSGTVASGARPAGNIGIVAQSGGAAQVNVMWRAQAAGLGLSYQASCGNSADLDVLDFVHFLIEDARTDVILVLAEDLKSGAKLVRVARAAAEREKPIVMLKLGRTEAGARAASSHTGAMTGSDGVHDAAFRQLGIIRVEDCNELYETAMLLRDRAKRPKGWRAAALSVSGGNAVLMADLGSRAGIEWPEYSSATQARLGEILPKHGRASNPTDITNVAVGAGTVYSRVIDAIAADPRIDAVMPVVTFAARSDLDEVVAASKRLDKPIALVWTGGCGDAPDLTPASLVEQGVAVYRDALPALKAMSGAMRYGAFLAARKDVRPERPPGIDPDAAAAILDRHGGTLGERVSRKVLAAYGFPMHPEALAQTALEAAKVARSLAGPVALKIESTDIPHKTDAGAIRLGVEGDTDVRRAFDDVLGAARRHAPQARIDGVLVQAMAPPGGTEIILGIATDATFGPVVMAGLGGIHAEVLKDVAFRVPPFDPAEALSMLKELRAWPLLEGVRGARRRDIHSLTDLICRLSWLAHDLGDRIAELDVNPLLLYPAGESAVVVDALITLKRGEGEVI